MTSLVTLNISNNLSVERIVVKSGANFATRWAMCQRGRWSTQLRWYGRKSDAMRAARRAANRH